MEKQEREHHESSADVTAKYTQELKDLGKKRISVSESGDSVSILLQLSISLNCLSVNQSFAELSYSQKLIVEHERCEDLQQKYQKMQEDYETQLKIADESRIQALEELTQQYEAKLQEKNELLTQVSQEKQMVAEEVEGTLHEFSCPLNFLLSILCSVRRMQSNRSASLKNS